MPEAERYCVRYRVQSSQGCDRLHHALKCIVELEKHCGAGEALWSWRSIVELENSVLRVMSCVTVTMIPSTDMHVDIYNRHLQCYNLNVRQLPYHQFISYVLYQTYHH